MNTLRTLIIGLLNSPGSLDIARRVYDTDYICPSNIPGGSYRYLVYENKNRK